MRSKAEIEAMMVSPYKVVEAALDIKIRNGQTIEGIRKALKWVKEG